MKRKGGISPEKFATDPKYDRMRRQNMEFTAACKSASLLKRAFDSITPDHAVNGAYQRLMVKCRDIIKSDASHELGYRQLLDGNANLFRNFDFMEDAKFNSVIYVPQSYSFDRATGTVTVSLPALDPAKMLKAPAKATHFRLTMNVGVLDFAEETFELYSAESTDVSLDTHLTEAIALTADIGANSTLAVFTSLTVRFIESANDVVTPVGSDRFNLMKMVAADFPA